jgi:hypothetical protein
LPHGLSISPKTDLPRSPLALVLLFLVYLALQPPSRALGHFDIPRTSFVAKIDLKKPALQYTLGITLTPRRCCVRACRRCDAILAHLLLLLLLR